MAKRWFVLACMVALGSTLLPAQAPPARKLTDDEKIELIRGLTAEYATVKSYLPRSKKALEFKSDGTWDKQEWQDIGREYGPVARTGELVQVTKIDIDSDKLVLEINGGLRTKGKWYERIEGGMGTGNRTVPLSKNQSRSAGTTIALTFPSRMPVVSSAEVKKMLAPVLDFEKRTVTENYFDSLPPEIQAAIKEKRAAVGMTKEQVQMALGAPRERMRETVDGLETEDWIYGLPPGKITFVTFANSKVIKIKDSYAGLGGTIAPTVKN